MGAANAVSAARWLRLLLGPAVAAGGADPPRLVDPSIPDDAWPVEIPLLSLPPPK